MRGTDVETIPWSQIQSDGTRWYDVFSDEAYLIGSNDAKIEEISTKVADIDRKMREISNGRATWDMERGEVDKLFALQDKETALLKTQRTLLNRNKYAYGIRGVTQTPSSQKQLEETVKNWGDGARGTVVIIWKGGKSSHIFNVVNDNGRVVAYDAQDGATNVLSGYYRRGNAQRVWLTRVDNLPLRKDALDRMTKRRG